MQLIVAWFDSCLSTLGLWVVWVSWGLSQVALRTSMLGLLRTPGLCSLDKWAGHPDAVHGNTWTCQGQIRCVDGVGRLLCYTALHAVSS